MSSYTKTPTTDGVDSVLEAREVEVPVRAGWRVPVKRLLVASALTGAAALAVYGLAPRGAAELQGPVAAPPAAVEQLSEHEGDLIAKFEPQRVQRRMQDKGFQRFLNATLSRALASGPLPGGHSHESAFRRILTPETFGDASDLEDVADGAQGKGQMTGYCVLDTVQATAFLGTAVVFLYESSSSPNGKRCPSELRAGCAASVNTIIAALGWVAGFLSMAASHCADTLNAQAACATDVIALVANLGNIGISASAFDSDCSPAKKCPPAAKIANFFKKLRAGKPLPKKDGGSSGLFWPPARGIGLFGSAKKDHAEQVAYNFGKAQCSFDVLNGASFLARAILQVMDAAHHCPNPRQCTMDVLNLVASFSWSASCLSLAAADCAPVVGDTRALCAADVTNLAAAVASFSSFTISSTEDCSPGELAHPDPKAVVA